MSAIGETKRCSTGFVFKTWERRTEGRSRERHECNETEITKINFETCRKVESTTSTVQMLLGSETVALRKASCMPQFLRLCALKMLCISLLLRWCAGGCPAGSWSMYAGSSQDLSMSVAGHGGRRFPKFAPHVPRLIFAFLPNLRGSRLLQRSVLSRSRACDRTGPCMQDVCAFA